MSCPNKYVKINRTQRRVDYRVVHNVSLVVNFVTNAEASNINPYKKINLINLNTGERTCKKSFNRLLGLDTHIQEPK